MITASSISGPVKEKSLIVRVCVVRHLRSMYLMAFVAAVAGIATLTLRLNESRAEHQYEVGCVQLRQHDYIGADRSFDNAIAIQPDQPMFFAARALERSRPVRATLSVDRPWQHLPAIANADMLLLQGAAEDYRRALSLSMNDAAFWSNLGWVEAYLHNDAQALDAFRQAVIVDPMDSTSRVSLGLFYERKGLLEDAHEQYAYALASSPRMLDSRFFADLTVRDPAGAAMTIGRCLDILANMPESPLVLASIAKVHAYQGHYEAASQELAVALQGLPDISTAWTTLGLVELAKSHSDSARLDFQRALALDPLNRVAVNQLAVIAKSAGNIPLARGLYFDAQAMPLASKHWERTWRIYHVPPVTTNDLIPSNLLEYVGPQLQPLDMPR
jgi:Tfp pilus assembly protein PilF